MRALIVGCGYVGLALGTELTREGHEVFGLRRSRSAEGELKAAGIKPLFGDVTRAEELASLPRDFDWVVNCVASGGGGAEEYRRVYLQGTRNLIEWLTTAPPRKLVYTSSTGVYDQNDGSIVDEASPTEPASETAQVLVETEKILLEAARRENFPAVILRVAGIYGPDRGYWLKQVLKGQAHLEGTGKRFLNMIHRDDVVGGILAALERARPGEIYNLVDDEPVSQLNLFDWLAAALDRRLPARVTEDAEGERKRAVTNKRVSNRKLKRELGYRFKHPTFREGYQAEILRLRRAGE